MTLMSVGPFVMVVCVYVLMKVMGGVFMKGMVCVCIYEGGGVCVCL